MKATDMKTTFSILCCAVAAAAFALPPVRPVLPPVAHDDTETTTNVSFAAATAVEAAPTSSVPDEVAMAVAEIENDLATIPSVVTNWVDARKAASCIRGKICRLPSVLSEQYGRKMVQNWLFRGLRKRLMTI